MVHSFTMMKKFWIYPDQPMPPNKIWIGHIAPLNVKVWNSDFSYFYFFVLIKINTGSPLTFEVAGVLKKLFK